MRKKVVVLTLLLLAIIPIVESNINTDYIELWNTDMNINNKAPNKLWWLNGYRADAGKNEWRTVADNLYSSLESDSSGLLKEVYGNVFVNAYNNTLFVVLTKTDKNTQDAILKILDPPEEVTVKFRQGPAPNTQLEIWHEKINQLLPTLREKGVHVSFAGITENATILIEVVEFNDDVIETLRNIVTRDVPPGIIVVRKGTYAELAWGRSEKIRPLLGGIKVTGKENGEWKYSSLGFYVIDNYNNKGVLVSGHGADLYTYAYQPTKTTANKIGSVTKDPEGSYADAAFVKLQSGVTGDNKVFNDTSLQHVVTGEKHYAYMTVGDPVKTQGYATNGRKTGEITFKGTTYHVLWEKDMYLQVRYDALIKTGDSGGPVYHEVWVQGNYRYEVTAYGINWGRNEAGGWSVFSPVSCIEYDMAVNLDFTG